MVPKRGRPQPLKPDTTPRRLVTLLHYQIWHGHLPKTIGLSLFWVWPWIELANAFKAWIPSFPGLIGISLGKLTSCSRGSWSEMVLERGIKHCKRSLARVRIKWENVSAAIVLEMGTREDASAFRDCYQIDIGRRSSNRFPTVEQGLIICPARANQSFLCLPWF
jgi:hypothetical protein